MDELARLALVTLPDVEPETALGFGIDLGIPPWLALGLAGARPDTIYQVPAARPRRWTPEERAFMRDNLGTMELDDIARALGRTPTAIKIAMRRRDLSPRTARLDAGVYNARQASRLLGASCSKVVTTWIRQGDMEGENAGNVVRPYWRITRASLLAFVASPLAAYCLDPARIADPELRAAWHRAGHPRHLSAMEVAARLGVCVETILRYCRAGKLRAVRYPNWLIPETELPALDKLLSLHKPKPLARFTSEEERILVGGVSLGYSIPVLAARLDRPQNSLYGRLDALGRLDDRWPVLWRTRGRGRLPATLGHPSAWPEFALAGALARWAHPTPEDLPHRHAWLRAWLWFWLHDDLPVASEATGLLRELADVERYLVLRLPQALNLEEVMARGLALLQLVGLDPATCSWHERWEPVRLGQAPASGLLSPCPANGGRVLLADVLGEHHDL